jgi:hypothetical protein
VDARVVDPAIRLQRREVPVGRDVLGGFQRELMLPAVCDRLSLGGVHLGPPALDYLRVAELVDLVDQLR